MRRAPIKSKPTETIQAIDLVRTLAILPVLALHSTPRLLNRQSLTEIWDHLHRNGGYGVSVFFMVSGFLITRILDLAPGGAFRPSWKNFYARRVGRILPLLLLDVLLGLFFWFFLRKKTILFFYCFHLPIHHWAANFWIPLLFFAFNWARAYWSLNQWGDISLHWGLLWSLAVEEQFYFFYPLILRWLGRPRRLIFFLLALLGISFGWRWFVMNQPLDNGLDWKWGSFGYFDQIGLGIGLYFIQKQWGSRIRSKPWAAGLLALAGTAGFAWVYWSTSGADLFDAFYAPSLATALLAAGLLGALNFSFFEAKLLRPLTWPGKYSYGNYLLHPAVLYFLAPHLVGRSIYFSFPVFVAASTMVAALSFHFFETPANRWVRTKFRAG
ncbi:MAG: acyltransferase family protein [bacterium]